MDELVHCARCDEHKPRNEFYMSELNRTRGRGECRSCSRRRLLKVRAKKGWASNSFSYQQYTWVNALLARLPDLEQMRVKVAAPEYPSVLRKFLVMQEKGTRCLSISAPLNESRWLYEVVMASFSIPELRDLVIKPEAAKVASKARSMVDSGKQRLHDHHATVTDIRSAKP